MRYLWSLSCHTFTMCCVHALCRKEKSDVIIVDDEDSPINAQRQLSAVGSGNSAQSADLHALKELLDQEEKKLNLLKLKRVRQTSQSELDIASIYTCSGHGLIFS